MSFTDKKRSVHGQVQTDVNIAMELISNEIDELEIENVMWIIWIRECYKKKKSKGGSTVVILF